MPPERSCFPGCSHIIYKHKTFSTYSYYVNNKKEDKQDIYLVYPLCVYYI